MKKYIVNNTRPLSIFVNKITIVTWIQRWNEGYIMHVAIVFRWDANNVLCKMWMSESNKPAEQMSSKTDPCRSMWPGWTL